MAKAEQISITQLLNDIKNRKFKPIYFLHGNEPYYIDLITDALIESVVPENERDFNQTILYGLDTDVAQIITSARRFPMMSEYQLIVVKEAQNVNKIEQLELYTRQPLESTILVINYKDKTLDGRSKLSKDLAAKGVLYESKKLYDDKIPSFVTAYAQSKNLSIDTKAAFMISDFIGSDLKRICSEIDKLAIRLNNGDRITPELIEQSIGISKEFNNFELISAIAKRDIYKANLIASMFAKNPKNNPFVVTNSMIFTFFSNLMLAYYAPDKSEKGIMNALNFRFSVQVRDYMAALKIYNAFKTMNNISLIREFDARSKGVRCTSVSDEQLLKELLYKLMH